jgi:hypothetical protein
MAGMAGLVAFSAPQIRSTHQSHTTGVVVGIDSDMMDIDLPIPEQDRLLTLRFNADGQWSYTPFIPPWQDSDKARLEATVYLRAEPVAGKSTWYLQMLLGAP